MRFRCKSQILFSSIALFIASQHDAFAQLPGTTGVAPRSGGILPGGGVILQGEGAVLYGEGAFLRGMGSYNLNTAEANAINLDTVIRWKQDLRNDQKLQTELLERKATNKRMKIADVKKQQQMRERQLRLTPTSDDIQNGSALNALLYDLADPDISPSDWTSKAVQLPKELSVKDFIFRFTPLSNSTNVSKALSRGVIALSRLDVEGNKWPTVMKQKELDKERVGYEVAYDKLRVQLIHDKFDLNALIKVDLALDNLKSKVDSAVPKDRGFREEALKYVSDLKDATRMFDAATVDYSREILIDTNGKDAKSVGELIGFMLKYRLQFASAERSATGRVLYRQLYEVMQKQANQLGIKPPDEELAK